MNIPIGEPHEIVKALGQGFAFVADDPRLYVRRGQEFIQFVNASGLQGDPLGAIRKYKQILGSIRVCRALVLDEKSLNFDLIFNKGVLLSRIAARHYERTGDIEEALKRSLSTGKDIDRGIRARLHDSRMDARLYRESEFVFSVARIPCAQLYPAIDFLYDGASAFLLEFDMPRFDLLGISIADVFQLWGKSHFTFQPNPRLHSAPFTGVEFDGQDPDTELFILHKTEVSSLISRSFKSADEVFSFVVESGLRKL